MDEQAIRDGLTRLGPARCRAALAAFGEGKAYDWRSCVLALAYGAPGVLAREFYAQQFQPNGELLPTMFAATRLGLTYMQARHVTLAFDATPATRERLRGLIMEHLG